MEYVDVSHVPCTYQLEMEGIPINKPTKPLGKSVWRKYSFVRIFEITAGMNPIKDSVLLGEVYYRTVSIIRLPS